MEKIKKALSARNEEEITEGEYNNFTTIANKPPIPKKL